jgi:hypothetical protein
LDFLTGLVKPHVDAINTSRVFAGRSAWFRVVNFRNSAGQRDFWSGSIPGSSTTRAAAQRLFFVKAGTHINIPSGMAGSATLGSTARVTV